MMALSAGDAFLLDPNRRTLHKQHAYVVTSDPAKDPERIVLFNFTSYDPAVPATPQNDPACTIAPGEHPYVTKPTCINYADVLILCQAQVTKLLDPQAGLAVLLNPVGPQLLERIRQGAIASAHISEKARTVLEDQMLI